MRPSKAAGRAGAGHRAELAVEDAAETGPAQLDPPTTGPVVACDARQAQSGQKGQDTPQQGGERRNKCRPGRKQIARRQAAGPRLSSTAAQARRIIASRSAMAYTVSRAEVPQHMCAQDQSQGPTTATSNRVGAAQGSAPRNPSSKGPAATGGKPTSVGRRDRAATAVKVPGARQQGSPRPSSGSSHHHQASSQAEHEQERRRWPHSTDQWRGVGPCALHKGSIAGPRVVGDTPAPA